MLTEIPVSVYRWINPMNNPTNKIPPVKSLQTGLCASSHGHVVTSVEGKPVQESQK